MKKTRKKQYKKIVPFVITAVASVSISSAIFVGFAAGQFDRLAKEVLTAAALDALQEDIPEGVAPFYKTKSFSTDTPGDADVVGMPILTLRDRILLTESRAEVKVALYNKDELQEGPYFSYTINNGNDQSYVAGEYGAGDFVIITTMATECWGQPLSVCESSSDKVAEWHYKVAADTFTYIIAPLDKRDVAIRNARKNIESDEASTTEIVVEEDKGIVETIVDTVTELFSGDDTDVVTEDDQGGDSVDAESGGFQILPPDEGVTSDEQSADEPVVPVESNESGDAPSADSGSESVEAETPAPAPVESAPAESSAPSEGNNE